VGGGTCWHWQSRATLWKHGVVTTLAASLRMVQVHSPHASIKAIWGGGAVGIRAGMKDVHISFQITNAPTLVKAINAGWQA